MEHAHRRQAGRLDLLCGIKLGSRPASKGLDRRQSRTTTFRFRILKAKIEYDQALLVRKERRCDVLQEIRKRHLDVLG